MLSHMYGKRGIRELDDLLKGEKASWRGAETCKEPPTRARVTSQIQEYSKTLHVCLLSVFP